MMNLRFNVIILLLTIFCIACKDDDEGLKIDSDFGVVTSADFRLCACCGGWFIEIEDQLYRFYELPENSISISDEEFPLRVDVKWELDQDGCMGDEIIITSIEKM